MDLNYILKKCTGKLTEEFLIYFSFVVSIQITVQSLRYPWTTYTVGEHELLLSEGTVRSRIGSSLGLIPPHLGTQS